MLTFLIILIVFGFVVGFHGILVWNNNYTMSQYEEDLENDFNKKE